ncbi:MAG: hypothetical protein IKA22_11150, partial [Lentisphaeria bacterium]|nr:hypothetical protein [Lentisphaeria bacterium]
TVRKYFPECEVLMGTSTAGIAHAAIVGHLMNLPMGYVRSGAKDHGRGNQIEGKLLPGQKVVVIEDLISTGGSAIDVVNVLRFYEEIIKCIVFKYSDSTHVRVCYGTHRNSCAAFCAV